MKALFFTLVVAIACFLGAISGDPDAVSDFLAPPKSKVDRSFFTFSGLRSTFNNFTPPTNFTFTKISMAELPPLNGQSVSLSLSQYPARSVNPLHTHPRAGEVLFLLYGVLEVGFVDTITNKLYTQRLQAGDAFVFPKGLLHYEFNFDKKDYAMAASAYGGANPGTVSLPVSVFTTGIQKDILAKTFKTDIATIEKIEAGLKASNHQMA